MTNETNRDDALWDYLGGNPPSPELAAAIASDPTLARRLAELALLECSLNDLASAPGGSSAQTSNANAPNILSAGFDSVATDRQQSSPAGGPDRARGTGPNPACPESDAVPTRLRLLPHYAQAGDSYEEGDSVAATIYCAARPSVVRRALPAVAVLAAALALVAAGWLWWPAGPKVSATLESRGDNVTAARGGETVRISDVWEMLPGDVIRTGGESKATLRFKNEDTAITLSRHAEMVLVATPAGKRLGLNRGQLEAVVDKQSPGTPLVCVTPQAIITVLGTRFFVTADAETTRVVVREGRVQVMERASQAALEVVAGQIAVARPQAPPQARSFEIPRADLPAGWLKHDVGSVGLPGSSEFMSARGAILMRGSGSIIAYEPDNFHFLYQPWRGDADIVVRLVSLKETEANAKAGIMIREDLSPGARDVMINFEPQYGTGAVDFRHRRASGGKSTISTAPGTPLPLWLRLVRRGDTFSGHHSFDGKTWKQVGNTISLPLGEQVFVGLAVTSHDDTATTLAWLDNLACSEPVPSPREAVSRR